MIVRVILVALIFMGALVGCGRSGLPVPPDDYGIGLRMQQERQKEEQARKEQDERASAAAKQHTEQGTVTPPEEVMLPDMRPVGGR